MVTTQRSNNGSTITLERRTALENIGFADNNVEEVKEVKSSNSNERIRENLQRLMNYDRYSEQYSDVAVEDAPVHEEVASSDEDMRPTSTTMQFGGVNINEIHNEMREEHSEKTAYRLQGKGKFAVILYSVMVAVVFALIVLNTGILSVLNGAKANAVTTLNDRSASYAQIVEEGEYLSSPERISEIAENELNMTK